MTGSTIEPNAAGLATVEQPQNDVKLSGGELPTNALVELMERALDRIARFMAEREPVTLEGISAYLEIIKANDHEWTPQINSLFTAKLFEELADGRLHERIHSARLAKAGR